MQGLSPICMHHKVVSIISVDDDNKILHFKKSKFHCIRNFGLMVQLSLDSSFSPTLKFKSIVLRSL